MSINIFYSRTSAPCSAVVLAARLLGLQFTLTPLNLKNREQFKPDFLKINFQHTVPTLVDADGFVIWESRAIIIYLVEKYGEKNSSLYPADLKKRTIIRQRLFFDQGTLYQRFAECYYPVIFADQIELEEVELARLDEALKFLDTYLSESKFAAGDDFTIADISLVPTVTTIQCCEYDLNNYTHITRWLKDVRPQFLAYEEINGKAVEGFQKRYLNAKKKNHKVNLVPIKNLTFRN